MTPQLYINEHYGSTVHLPWDEMWLRFSTTFIDDVFACVVRMPTEARLACFRDDVVFIGVCWQRWRFGGRTRERDKEKEE